MRSACTAVQFIIRVAGTTLLMAFGLTIEEALGARIEAERIFGGVEVAVVFLVVLVTIANHSLTFVVAFVNARRCTFDAAAQGLVALLGIVFVARDSCDLLFARLQARFQAFGQGTSLAAGQCCVAGSHVVRAAIQDIFRRLAYNRR